MATPETMTTEEVIRRHQINVGYRRMVEAGIEVAGNQPEERPTHCPCCKRENNGDVANRRLNTAYVKDELNWLLSCFECHQEAVEQYKELWDTYHHG